jgi:hypothetical protein
MRFWHVLAWSVVVYALITVSGVMTAPLLLILAADTIVVVLIVRECLGCGPTAAAHNQGDNWRRSSRQLLLRSGYIACSDMSATSQRFRRSDSAIMVVCVERSLMPKGLIQTL